MVSGCGWMPPGGSSPSEGHLTSWRGCETHLTPALWRGWCPTGALAGRDPTRVPHLRAETQAIAAGTWGVTNQRLSLAVSRAKSRSEDVARTMPLLPVAWPSSLPVSSCCCLTSLRVGAGATPRTGDLCGLRHLTASGWVRGDQRGSQDSAWPSWEKGATCCG